MTDGEEALIREVYKWKKRNGTLMRQVEAFARAKNLEFGIHKRRDTLLEGAIDQLQARLDEQTRISHSIGFEHARLQAQIRVRATKKLKLGPVRMERNVAATSILPAEQPKQEQPQLSEQQPGQDGPHDPNDLSLSSGISELSGSVTVNDCVDEQHRDVDADNMELVGELHSRLAESEAYAHILRTSLKYTAAENKELQALVAQLTEKVNQVELQCSGLVEETLLTRLADEGVEGGSLLRSQLHSSSRGGGGGGGGKTKTKSKTDSDIKDGAKGDSPDSAISVAGTATTLSPFRPPAKADGGDGLVTPPPPPQSQSRLFGAGASSRRDIQLWDALRESRAEHAAATRELHELQVKYATLEADFRQQTDTYLAAFEQF